MSPFFQSYEQELDFYKHLIFWQVRFRQAFFFFFETQVFGGVAGFVLIISNSYQHIK